MSDTQTGDATTPLAFYVPSATRSLRCSMDATAVVDQNLVNFLERNPGLIDTDTTSETTRKMVRITHCSKSTVVREIGQEPYTTEDEKQDDQETEEFPMD